MPKRPHYLALSLVVIFVVLLLNLPSRKATQIKFAVGGLFLPLLGLTTSAQSVTQHIEATLPSRRSLLRQMDELRRENAVLRLRDMQIEEIWRENERLREALGWRKQSRWRSILAKVVLRDPANWWHSVQINKGQRDGISTNSPVLTADGLVGRVTRVGYSTSEVALVGDPACGVSAVVEGGPARDYGVINSGSADILDLSVVGLTFINRQAAIQPGQRVLTSGLGEVFPPGILIGHVIDTNSIGFGLYIESRVKLSADLNNLEEVFVIFP